MINRKTPQLIPSMEPSPKQEGEVSEHVDQSTLKSVEKTEITALIEELFVFCNQNVKHPKKLNTPKKSAYEQFAVKIKAYAGEGNRNIVTVDSDFKKNCPCIEKKEKAFSLKQYHPLVSELKVSDIYDSKFHDNGYLLTFTLSDNTKKRFLVLKGENTDYVSSMLQKLTTELPSEKKESFLFKHLRKEAKALPKEYWGESNNWDSDSHGIFYDTVSDPLIEQMFEAHILKNPNKEPLLIFDIGGGKGRLAVKLLELAQKHNQPLTYILIEPDSFQCNEAKKNIQLLRDKYGQNFLSNVVVEETFFHPFYKKNKKGLIGTAQGIISSGGPLNYQVVDQKTAKANLSEMVECLAPGGIIIATGLSPLLITKKEFAKIGLDVVNTARDVDVNKENKLLQCYVCVKSEIPKHQQEKNKKYLSFYSPKEIDIQPCTTTNTSTSPSFVSKGKEDEEETKINDKKNPDEKKNKMS